MLKDGFREGDYVYEDRSPGERQPTGPHDKKDILSSGIWRYRPIREPAKDFERKLPRNPYEALAADEEPVDPATYRAIRVLVIEGTKEFVRETMKRSKIDEKVPTAFLEQGGTVSYRATKFEKVMEIEEAELGE